jgi:hypothetical protein
MPSAKYTEVYKKVSQMGEKLKAAGKQGPSNDEQLSVRLSHPQAPPNRDNPSPSPILRTLSRTLH